MYALVVFLWLLAFIVLERWWRRRQWWSGVAGSLLVWAMVLTQYWSLFVVAAVGVGAVVVALRGDKRGWWLLLPLAVGSLGMAPWLPSLLFQLRHTGAPWGSPPSVGKTFQAPRDWAGSGPLGSGDVLAAGYYVLAAVAVFGAPVEGGVAITRRWRQPAATLLLLAFGTMFIGTAVNGALGSAYSSRYSAVALAPFLLGAAWGFSQLPQRARVVTGVVVALLGLAASIPLTTRIRTQADETAAALSPARPGDVVVFCPDQLGPAVHRLAPDAGRQVVYPTMGSAAMVDWVDYADRNEAADPERFTHALLDRAGTSASIWVVYEPGYPTFGDDCNELVVDLAAQRGAPETVLPVETGAMEKERVVRFAPG
jgi:hypothetical protein